ncbi:MULTISPECIES: lysophospholipid acyltransferase family protein [Flavobacterium]|uniref:lysophospholipid acyltransferase family protein n=1 Tax=Flavobacterium TaxID=237 RepID=UPI00086CCBCA|nr:MULTISPECIES: lysophospholipid acyltransferase family protein [Flavobacterium]MBN9283390.1 1-acyl-sn-glycerol-3-phosphate acyltransferase [Flavobacterium sp.]ODS87089.1 MAG: glycerol acyltransferase [Chryseobacterium sp. SCN 40-13]OJV69486.1 MAG: 1-acyl-sn-glycerol-3-phosphate acyltransferase [Flavobacterium sp. 40-81]
MQKIISYPLSVIYYLFFGLCLVIFHPIQWICLNLFGYQAHKKSVDYLNFLLVKCTNLLGTTYTFEHKERIPANVPVIFVANHQSMYDIVGIIWYLRRSHPKFVSKKELGKGIPSVSYNLRHGGSVLIDRKDPKQALPTIKSLADYIQKHQRAAVIFPEGTRSKTGVPKRFSENGLKILCKYAPSAYIVPISINNSWKMVRFGAFPMGLGNKLKFTIHEPIAVKDHSFQEIMEKTENAVVQGIKN